MLQLAQYQNGRLELQEVPRPTAPPGGILVRLTHSVISVGTERMKVEQAKMNLLQKARARPDQVRKVLDTARNLGWRAAIEKVRNRLESPTPLGYSAAGVVAAVDPGNTRFRIGDRVACGGAECAFHAEFVALPDLLAAPVPRGVDNTLAAYTTLASIALQTVRQLEPRLGDRVLVIGQGLIGLLVTHLLTANGCRVAAVDLAENRRAIAHTLGAERFLVPGARNMADDLRLWTEGFGVDAAVLATATSSNTPTEQALDALRDRGRLVVVGNTHVELPWKTAYEKEIEVRYSRSYGPGRYDPAYEWAGVDYPIGFVRWTEQRNFDACLHLMQTGRLRVDLLTSRRVPFRQCLDAYRELAAGSADIGVVLEYDTPPETADSESPIATAASPLETVRPVEDPSAIRPLTAPVEGPDSATPHSSAPSPAAGLEGVRPTERRRTAPVVALDVVGAGNFARTMLLPHLVGKVPFGTVVNQTPLSANHVRAKFGFSTAATDGEDMLADPAGGASATAASRAVLIATRHHLHARFVLAALARGRDVFVEKPLCLTVEELGQIDAAMATSTGTIQIGFNRRFAPASAELKRIVDAAPGPKTASFRVMAGRLDPSHWYANLTESGGRVLGEACHFLDFFCFLFGVPPVRVTAQTTWPTAGRLPFPDSVTAQVEFADGSCGQLVYTAEGDSTWPKEVCTVFGAGFTAEIENFQHLAIHRGRRSVKRSFRGKGHAEQMAAWAAYLRGEAPHPLPYALGRRSMALTFATLAALQQGTAPPPTFVPGFR